MKVYTPCNLFGDTPRLSAIGWRKCLVKAKSTAASSHPTIAVRTTQGGIYRELLHTTRKLSTHGYAIVFEGQRLKHHNYKSWMRATGATSSELSSPAI